MSVTSQIFALIHGYGGGSFELDYLHRFLLLHGCDARFVLLDGHESTRRDFAKSTCQSWLASAAEALKSYRQECDVFTIVGFSMGGLIAANLFERIRPDKIVFVNTPVYYWNWKKIAQNVLCDIRSGDYSNIKRYAKTSLDKPLPTLVQFQSLLVRSKRLFGSVTCPALVTQCLDDDTVRPKSAAYIYQRLGGQKQLKLYEGGAHQVFDTEVALRLCQDIEAFTCLG